MSAEPYTLYVMYISYFSGKMQAYLRYKEIAHRTVELRWNEMLRVLLPNTGLMKVPAVRTPEGQWLADSTPMIDWFETRDPDSPVLPDDPALAFTCRLLEDYADEWLWRPALHYRWSYRADAHALSRRFAETFLSDMPGPAWLTAAIIRDRQRRIYVKGDGVTPATRAHVESVYLDTLDRLQAIFEKQDFLLGARPCLADFGFFASMFRHFSLDPTPSLIMQERAPAVYAWVARLWNARASQVGGEWPRVIPENWSALLRDAAESYLPYLRANAQAFAQKQRRFDFEIDGVCYRALPVVQYRVWCLERLQRRYAELPDAARSAVAERLGAGGTGILQAPLIASGLYQDVEPPVCRPRDVSSGEKLRRWFTGTHWHFPRPAVRR